MSEFWGASALENLEYPVLITCVKCSFPAFCPTYINAGMKHSRLGDTGYYLSLNTDVSIAGVADHCSSLGLQVLMPYPPGVFQHYIDLYPGT